MNKLNTRPESLTNRPRLIGPLFPYKGFDALLMVAKYHFSGDTRLNIIDAYSGEIIETVTKESRTALLADTVIVSIEAAEVLQAEGLLKIRAVVVQGKYVRCQLVGWA